jgi:hypothetical protein
VRLWSDILPLEDDSPRADDESDQSLYGLDNIETTRRGFVRGCFAGLVLALPFWIVVGYIVWRWLSGE